MVGKRKPVIDAQSVKNADTAERKSYDAGKKNSGVKRRRYAKGSYNNGRSVAVL
ncbi:hypothetical protein HET73_04250 [Wolbachia endosymbiont of Atemnus politus]|uniref:hypothetical protein n=1 Tax=Wolbachia endosymbiont of Atemnus politus TaxID=2682840 RepID=UPI001572C45B|nr:hypothetical protein [Wolbachia endosymbiont of Atemnus politus]NSM56657.1 hypothetical protein [Wolbachia endosymbiont of Atemnus politus]